MEIQQDNGRGEEEEPMESNSKWTLAHFMVQCEEIGRWLAQIYGAIYGNEQKFASKAVRMVHAAELSKRSRRRDVVNRHGEKLLQEHPDKAEEIQLRLDQLNANWDTLLHALAIRRPKRKDGVKPICREKDVVSQVKCLRDWLTNMEVKLAEFAWNRDEESRELLERKLRQHAVLQAEIQSEGSSITRILRFCERWKRGKRYSVSPDFVFEIEADDEADENADAFNGLTEDVAGLDLAAKSLERRWHRLWLSSLERQFTIEDRLQRLLKGGPPSERWSESDRDEEPLSKYPRLATGSASQSNDDDDDEIEGKGEDGDGSDVGIDCARDADDDESACWLDVNETETVGLVRPGDDDAGGDVENYSRDGILNEGADLETDNLDDLRIHENGVPEFLTNSSDETPTPDLIVASEPEDRSFQEKTEDNSMTTDLEVSKEPGSRLSSSSPIAGTEGVDTTDAKTGGAQSTGVGLGRSGGGTLKVPVGLKPPSIAVGIRDRDKYSPGKLCGSHWIGPNCASFHFKEDAGPEEEEEEEEDDEQVEKGRKATSPKSPSQGRAAAQSKVLAATPQQQQQRPKLVARVSPRRRLELGNDEYCDRIVKASAQSYNGEGGSSALATTRNKDWWLTSSDSDWLNTEGLSDSDASAVSGAGAARGGVVEGDRTIVHQEEEEEGEGGLDSIEEDRPRDGVQRSLSDGARNGRPQHLSIPRSCSKHSIHRLVNAADEMVRRDGAGAGAVGGVHGHSVNTASSADAHNHHHHQRQNHRRQYSLPGRHDETCQRGAKVDRVTAWLSSHHLVKVGESPDCGCLSDAQMADSCDASGEYTTEDSDSRASPSPSDSEERNSSSVVTCHLQQSRGLHGPDTDLDTPVQEKLPCLPVTDGGTKRRRKLSDGALPWTLSSQSKQEYGSSMELGRGKRAKPAQAGGVLDSRWNLSKSDGALNSLPATEAVDQPKKLPLLSTSARSKRHFGSLRNFPSGTLMPQRASSFSGSRPWRDVRSARKKEQERITPRALRKKHTASNWGSASGLTAKGSTGSLKKSRSFSGRCHLNSAYRDLSFSDPSTPMDPAASQFGPDGSLAAQLGPSTEDLVVECRPANIPAVNSLLLPSPEEILPSVSLKNDEDTCPSLLEECSSVSEQAWDPYQAPVFVDENYSESGMDSEAVKKLLDWDDDYRNALDSLSDAASSVAPPKHANPSVMATVVRRRAYPGGGGGGSGVQYRAVRRRKAIRQCHGGRALGDSDSDMDASKTPWDPMNRRSWHAGSPRTSLILDGSHNYSAGESVPAEKAAHGTSPRKSGVRSPRKKSLDSASSFDAPGFHKRNASDPLPPTPCPSSEQVFLQAKKMKEDLEELKARMQDVEARVQAAVSSGSIRSKEDLSGIVEKLKACMQDLASQKRVLVSLNLDVHFLASAPENIQQTPSAVAAAPGDENAQLLASRLKELVEQLYRRWDDIQHTTGGSVVKMERALCDWQDWEDSYTDLMSTLNDEKQAVGRVCHAWNGVNGGVGNGVTKNDAGVVEGLARIVSCGLHEQKLESNLASLDAHLQKIPSTLESSVDKCEERLKAIEERGRKIVDAMPVRPEVSQFFRQAMGQAAEELTSLQANCRRLVTSAREKSMRFSPVIKRRRMPEQRIIVRQSLPSLSTCAVRTALSSFPRRVLRSALPLQALLLAMLWIAFCVEPNCCDPSGSFASRLLSLAPLVRYNHGPPPS